MSTFVTQKNNFMAGESDLQGYHPPPVGKIPVGLPPTGSQKSNRRASAYAVAQKKSILQGNRSHAEIRNSSYNGPNENRHSVDNTLMGYPGMLPTLGLTKYKETDLTINQKNPYKIQNQTEKLLVFRERQRDFRDFNKLEKEGQRVYEKEMGSRPNRQGVIREIRAIKGNKSALTKGKEKLLNNQDDQNAQNKAKINIFDQQDSTMLKREALAKLGYEEQRALVPTQGSKSQAVLPLDQRSVSSNASSRMTLEPISKPKAIEYLKQNKEGKESVKDFINFSRQILMSQISINTKNEENERLKEYILMEQEKLNEAKKFLEEDKEKFTKLMEDQKHEADDIVKKVKDAVMEKNDLIAKYEEKQNLIHSKQAQIKKCDDDLITYKQQKHFLDIIAMQAGKKKYQMKKKGGPVTLAPTAESQASSTFMTQPTLSKNQKGNVKKQQKSKPILESSNQSSQDQDVDQKGLLIEMEEDYSDDDFTIYFDRAQLINHLTSLEDDNLFRIKLVEDDEQVVKKINEDALKKYNEMQEKIDEVEKSITQLQKTKDQLMIKNRYLSGSVNQQTQQEKIDKKKQNDDDKNTDGSRAIKKKTFQQILMDMDPNCSKDQCDKFNRLITEILKSCQIEDDRSSIVQTLTKIESRLNYLCEARNILFDKDTKGKIQHTDKNYKSIKLFENQVDQDRREKKFKETQDENNAREQEIKQKQREKAEKARNQILFRGLPLLPRSSKIAFKPCVVLKEEMSPQTRDEKEYLDFELFTILQEAKKKEESEDEQQVDEQEEAKMAIEMQK